MSWAFYNSSGAIVGGFEGAWKFFDSSGNIQTSFSSGVSDHGGLTGLSDDDHAQYLKEKASGGLASEIPLHTHESSGEGGTIATGYFEPLTNGIVADPELIFANGDVIMVEIP